MIFDCFQKIILKKLPFNPEFYNPVQLLFELIPRLKIREKRINNSNPLLYEAQCELNGVQFTGCGNIFILQNRLYIYIYIFLYLLLV